MCKKEAERAVRAERAISLGEDRADVAHRAVVIVTQTLDKDGHASWSIALKGELLEVLGFLFRLVNRTIDVILGHIDTLSIVDRHAEARVTVDIRSAFLYRNCDFLEYARERLASLRIGSPLLTLDRRPFIMP